MLTAHSGTDIAGAKKAIQASLDAVRSKGGDVATFTDANFSLASVRSYLGAANLFGQSSAVFLDRVLAHPEAAELLSDIEAMRESGNSFFWLEEKFTEEFSDALDEYDVEVKKGKAPAMGKKDAWSPFALADALGARDRKELWVLYAKALRRGENPEGIAGMLLWQAKNMLLTARGGGAALNPFVKSKAARFAKNYSEAELEKLSSDLVVAYHEGHRGGADLSGRLERLILNI